VRLSHRLAAAAALLLPCLGAASAAEAAGFASAEFGGELGNVVATNPTALYYNPGAIGFSEGTHLYLDGVLALRNGTFTHAPAATDVPEPPGAEGANSGRAHFFNVFGAPMAGATTRLGALALGAAFSVPFGGNIHWDGNSRFAGDPRFPLAADGPQRWTVIEGQLSSLYFTLGAAYRLGRLSVGVSGNVVRSSIRQTQAKNPTGLGDPDVSNEGRDIPVKQKAEGEPEDRYVISLVQIRKVHEFVLHHSDGNVLIFHNCDTKFARLVSVRYPRNGKPTFISDVAFAENDFQKQLAFWFERMPGR